MGEDNDIKHQEKRKKERKKDKTETPEENKLFPNARQENVRSAKKKKRSGRATGKKEDMEEEEETTTTTTTTTSDTKTESKGENGRKKKKVAPRFRSHLGIRLLGRKGEELGDGVKKFANDFVSVGRRAVRTHANVRRQHCRSGASAR